MINFPAGGMLLSFALATENLTLSLATASSLGKINFPVKKSIVVIFVLAAIFLGTTVLGNTLLSHLSDANLEMVLSFGLAALLFLVTEELLVKAHEQKDTIWYTAPFFLGFLLFLILGVIS
jgi:ZIP family zinc transporter